MFLAAAAKQRYEKEGVAQGQQNMRESRLERERARGVTRSSVAVQVSLSQTHT